MPFRSKAQLRLFAEMVKLGKMSKKEFKKWLRETPDIKHLPERIAPKKRARHKRKTKRRK